MREAGERNYDIGIIKYKMSVKVSKTKERLNLLDGFRGRPLEDCVDF